MDDSWTYNSTLCQIEGGGRGRKIATAMGRWGDGGVTGSSEGEEVEEEEKREGIVHDAVSGEKTACS